MIWEWENTSGGEMKGEMKEEMCAEYISDMFTWITTCYQERFSANPNQAN